MKTSNYVKPLVLALAAATLGACMAPPQQAAWEVAPLTRVREGGVTADGWYRLGRAYQAHQRRADAIAAYRRALERDATHVPALKALGGLFAEAGEKDRSLMYLRVAAALSPAVAPQQGGDASAAVAIPEAAGDGGFRLVQVEPGVYELRPPAGQPSPVPAPQAAARIEVANGNGVAGMARLTAQHLASRGVAVERVSNQKPFAQAATEIRYLAGQDAAAARVRAALPVRAALVPVTRLARGIEVKLVLGRDAAAHARAFAAPPATVAHAPPQ